MGCFNFDKCIKNVCNSYIRIYHKKFMNTTLHITIDKDIKQRAQRLAKELGLDISTIVKASLKTFVQTEIFHVEKTNSVTPYLAEVITQAKKELLAGKAFGPFSGDKLDAFLMPK